MNHCAIAILYRLLHLEAAVSTRMGSIGHSLGGSLVQDFLLEWSWLGEAKSNLVGGELVVAVGNGGESAEHNLSVKWV